MTTTLRSHATHGARLGAHWPLRRWVFVGLVLGSAGVPGHIGETVRGVLTDAYIGVAVFVAFTFFAVYGLERVWRIDTAAWLARNKRLQVPAAAFLGMLPGCAGAILVAAAYSGGTVSLGTMVAALTATMGDAAFLLIATKPQAAAAILPIAAIAGIATGYVVDRITPKRQDFAPRPACEISKRIGGPRARDLVFAVIAIPGLAIGALNAALIDLPPWLSAAEAPIALAGVAATLAIWAASPVHGITAPSDAPLVRTAEETGFVTLWVVVAFLIYALFELATGDSLATVFAAAAPLVPLLAIVVGLIPGCGPQVLVATLYLNGALPFAALIGNAISNDGDALFPALALNRKAALLATFYSAIPALIVAYGFYLLAPGFLN